MIGTVYLVGAGPGAPDLLTLRAARLLERADIVFHDAPVHPDTLALAARAEKVAVGKRCGRHSTAQKFINKRLADAARRSAVVVRLKGGDPMLFGRAQEEMDALQAGCVRELRVVPVFLGAGGHLKTDLPRMVDELRTRYPDLAIAVDPPIGEQAGVIAAIASAIAR